MIQYTYNNYNMYVFMSVTLKASYQIICWSVLKTIDQLPCQTLGTVHIFWGSSIVAKVICVQQCQWYAQAQVLGFQKFVRATEHFEPSSG